MEAGGTDWGRLYRDNVAALTALARELTPEELAAEVPATPSWTVRDVLAHLAGAAVDAVTGRMDGAPSPEWTARHVSERIGIPVEDLLAELRDHQDAIAGSVAGTPRPALAWDVAVHHADLHEALGRGALDERFWRPVVEAVGAMRLGPLGVGRETIPPYELFRALFSRRSRAQMRAWGLPLTDEQLDELCVFGPREDDQPVPA